MHEVIIPFSISSNNLFGGRKFIADNELVERTVVFRKDRSSLNIYSPTDKFSDWLLENCKSWKTFYPHVTGNNTLAQRVEGVVFGFEDPKDAIMVKLSWL